MTAEQLSALLHEHVRKCDPVDVANLAMMLHQNGQRIEQQPVPDEQYPPCDFCGVIPDHHPWHGSGMFKGVDSPHIHACNGCRHLLPSRTAQPAPDVSALAEALEELINLVEDTLRGEYLPDSFTTQPARIAIDAYRKGVE